MTAEGVNSARTRVERSERSERSDKDVMASVEYASAELFGEPVLRRTATSVHAELCALYAQCDEASEDFTALAPSPTIDRCLGRLVEIIRGDYAPGLDEPTRAGITRLLCKCIAERPALAQKARAIRRIAALAEAQMEHHVSKALLATLTATSAVAAGEAGEQRLRNVLAGFPYTESYAQLVRAEIALLQAPLRPAFGVQPLPLAGATIAICGCGPLPLTGVMLQLATGARIVLIDRDPIALQRAAALVFQLERTGVVPARRFELRLADGGEVTYGRGQPAGEREHIACDALLIASLVPNAAKLRTAERVRETQAAGPFRMIVRSAEALCALLAYEAVCTDKLSDGRLVYCGKSAPRRRAQLDRELLAVADRSVLNTSELYVRADHVEPGISLLPT